jgi:putative ABC transport system ATP-binding protein
MHGGGDPALPGGGQAIAVLDGVSFEVPQGQFMAIIGRPARAIHPAQHARLPRPPDGEALPVRWHRRLHPRRQRAGDFRNRRIGFVFQSFHLQPRCFLRGADEGLEQGTHDLLERMRLQCHPAHRPGQLSGSRVAGEVGPTADRRDPGNLDSKSAADVLALIAEVQQAARP